MDHEWQEVVAVVAEEAAEAVGEIMLRHGAHGVAYESDALIREAMANRWGDYYPELSGDPRVMVKAYFHAPQSSAELKRMREEIEGLVDFGLNIGQVELTARVILESEWASAWKQHYHPVRIGRVVIEPSWEPAAACRPDDVVITLDPGMAFGTGTHPTTAMCIAALQDHSLDGLTVWDVGTGSGILAITAAKFGAKAVQAVDIDPVAAAACRDNAARNGADISCRQGSLADLEGTADVIIANIIADVIIEMMPEAAQKLNSGGLFITSGIIDSRVGDVLKAAAANGFQLEQRREQGEWVCLEFRR